MRKQARKNWCGPAAAQNALEALGERVSQKNLAAHCGTTKDGTTEFQLAEGLNAVGYSSYNISEDEKFLARSSITTALRFGSPVLLCVEDWGHWVTLVAPPLLERYPVVDPEKGVIELIHWKNLERTWRASARLQTGPKDRTYFAIALWR